MRLRTKYAQTAPSKHVVPEMYVAMKVNTSYVKKLHFQEGDALEADYDEQQPGGEDWTTEDSGKSL